MLLDEDSKFYADNQKFAEDLCTMGYLEVRNIDSDILGYIKSLNAEELKAVKQINYLGLDFKINYIHKIYDASIEEEALGRLGFKTLYRLTGPNYAERHRDPSTRRITARWQALLIENWEQLETLFTSEDFIPAPKYGDRYTEVEKYNYSRYGSEDLTHKMPNYSFRSFSQGGIIPNKVANFGKLTITDEIITNLKKDDAKPKSNGFIDKLIKRFKA